MSISTLIKQEMFFFLIWYRSNYLFPIVNFQKITSCCFMSLTIANTLKTHSVFSHISLKVCTILKIVNGDRGTVMTEFDRMSMKNDSETTVKWQLGSVSTDNDHVIIETTSLKLDLFFWIVLLKDSLYNETETLFY